MVTLYLKVKPGNKVDYLLYDVAGLLHAKIKAPAQDGKANAYLVDFLAKEFSIAKSKVTIVAGLTNPYKRIEIDVTEEFYERFLADMT